MAERHPFLALHSYLVSKPMPLAGEHLTNQDCSCKHWELDSFRGSSNPSLLGFRPFRSKVFAAHYTLAIVNYTLIANGYSS